MIAASCEQDRQGAGAKVKTAAYCLMFLLVEALVTQLRVLTCTDPQGRLMEQGCVWRELMVLSFSWGV